MTQIKSVCSRKAYTNITNNHDRKAVACVISKHRLSMVGFACITTEQKGRDFLLGMPFEKFCKLLPDYQPEDISLLFAR